MNEWMDEKWMRKEETDLRNQNRDKEQRKRETNNPSKKRIEE